MSKVKMKVKKKFIPKLLQRRKQWVAWYLKLTKDGKLTKVPIDVNKEGYASVNDLQTCGTCKQAYHKYKENNLDGIGFVLTKGDPFVAIDLDNCRNPKTGKLTKFAKRTIETIKSYTEVSPSGEGIRIITIGKIPGPGRKNERIEMYDDRRYVTITGQCLEGFPKKIKKKPKTIRKIYEKYFGTKSTDIVANDHSSPCLLSNEEIIRKAMNAANSDKFGKLWEGDHSDYKSRSEADLALYSMLAYWTGRDRVKCDKLFGQSGLGKREKWRTRSDYRKRTADTAFTSCREVYKPDPRQSSKEKVKELLESLRNNPSRAVNDILTNKTALNDLAILCKHDTGYYEAIFQDLKSIGFTVRDMNSLRKAIKAEVKISLGASYFNPIEKAELLPVKNLLPNAPVSDDLVLPYGWDVNDGGMFKKRRGGNNTDEQIAPRPVLIQGHLKNMTDSTENIRLAWLSHGGWEIRTVNRITIADSKSIVKLADLGCPVTSVSASRMVDYLAAFEAINLDNLPRAAVTHQMGWQGGNMDTFLWGKNVILPDTKLKKNADIDKMPPDEWPEKLIFFKGHDRGEDQIASGFHKKGKFSEWIEIEPLIKKYSLVTFAIYAALSPPLLEILDAPIFIVDWAYQTSRGKTTALKIAGSCWGNPDMTKSDTIVKTWNATRVWLERAQIVLRNLPLILDDTKLAKNPLFVSQLLYDFTSGQSRGRGSIDGTRSTGSWKTIILSSGESKAVNFSTNDGGAHARVLSLWGSPFGKKNKKKARLITQLKDIIHKNYGHAGYRFVRYLIEHKADWDEYRAKYLELVQHYRNWAGTSEVALRQCEYYAVTHLAAILAKKALGLTIDYKKHLERVFKKAIAETSEADRAKEALQTVMSWTISNRDFFWRSSSNNEKQPLGGWLGVVQLDETGPTVKFKKDKKQNISEMDDDVDARLISVAFMTHQLEKFLKEKGYEPKSIIRTWKDKGWLDTVGEKKGLTKKVSINGERTRCYVIPEAVIEKMNR